MNKLEPMGTHKGLHVCCTIPLKRPGCGPEQAISRILSLCDFAATQGAIIYLGRTLVVNQSWPLVGIQEACFAYSLSNLSALEWVNDHYQSLALKHHQTLTVSDFEGVGGERGIQIPILKKSLPAQQNA